MRDVATRAGVSSATVSRTLRGQAVVAPETRERVLRAVADLHYVVSPAASGLSSGRTGVVGVVAPRLTRWYYAQVVAGAGQVLREHGFDMLLQAIGDSTGRARFFERPPLSRRVDGIIFCSIGLQPAEREVLGGMDVPLALVGAALPGCSSARIDDVGGAADATAHLRDLGHRDIALISSRVEDGFAFTAPVDRRHGWEQAAHGPGRAGIQVTAPWGVAGGAAAMAELLASPSVPTGVFAESDEMAFGALQTLGRAGLTVPGDVSVIGFDDHEMADVLDLTTVAQPVRQLGQESARLLIESLQGADSQEVVLSTRLVVRGSTGPPRAVGGKQAPLAVATVTGGE